MTELNAEHRQPERGIATVDAEDYLLGGEGLRLDQVRPAYLQVADQLLELILAGDLSAGDRLPSEADLCVNFGVSPGIVREGLRVLASRDLITLARGTYVSRISPDEVARYLETVIGLLSSSDVVPSADICEVRELLEVASVRMASEQRTQEHIGALRDAIAHESASRGHQRGSREPLAFHGLVVQASGNGLLRVMTEPMFRVLRARLPNPDLSPQLWAQVDQDHEQILAAIVGKDADRAAEAMRQHLAEVGETHCASG